MRFVWQPRDQFRLGDILLEQFENHSWKNLIVAIAFVKMSGVRHVSDALRDFCGRGNRALFAVGVDCQGTSFEGLNELHNAVGSGGEIWIVHNELNYTFHPKLFVFENEESANVIIGSGNLTEGGLFTNYEAGIFLELDKSVQADADILGQIHFAHSSWISKQSGVSKRLDLPFLDALFQNGYIVTEEQARADIEESGRRGTLARKQSNINLFASQRLPSAPKTKQQSRKRSLVVPSTAINTTFRGFVMTLQNTDVGVGQTTPGTARRSPEVFIPLVARDLSPGFWEWPDEFTEHQTKQHILNRDAVRMRIGHELANVTMMVNQNKRDLRLRHELLRSAGDVGDILRVERPTVPSTYSYDVRVIPQSSSDFAYYKSLCTNPVRNSEKRFGYYT